MQPEDQDSYILPASLDIARIVRGPQEALDYVLPEAGLLAGTVGTLVAPTGIGASMFVLQLAVDLASGANSLELSRDLCRVLLVSAGDPVPVLTRGIQSVLAASARSHLAAAASNLDVAPAFAGGMDLLQDGPRYRQAIAARGEGCRLIILDAVNHMYVGDEASRTDASRLVSHLEWIAARTGAAVLGLHSVPRVTSTFSQQAAAKLAAPWVDDIKWLGHLSPVGESEAAAMRLSMEDRRTSLQLTVTKATYGGGKQSFVYARRVGFLLTPLHPPAQEPHKAKSKESRGSAPGKEPEHGNKPERSTEASSYLAMLREEAARGTSPTG